MDKAKRTEENNANKLNVWRAKMSLKVKELGTDHKDWLEKNYLLVQKINAAKESVSCLLTEVIKMENRVEQLESNQCQSFDTEEEEEEASDQKFYKDMTVMNREMKKYQLRQEEETEAEMIKMRVIKAMKPPSPPKPCLETNTSSRSTNWKRVLRTFLIFYVFTIFVFSCYVLLIDPTFIFDTMIPMIFGRQTMWDLKALISPFLVLKVDELLPT
ncbi:single-pass membrane and coiled-coil domain-containing protein 2 [Dromiciops gliroides]|uniref:single-pass membrane and coiled-coil domain-containing protein 2 n=1 Tax=Dromiciops gliroides TaxID=33562 RepID=UPI001CC4B0DB|nr:single-pass membrane and coiled-coil domain-containing protein 2 [Dromiciops gliroides]